jgi:hypothetical protein
MPALFLPVILEQIIGVRLNASEGLPGQAGIVNE